MRRCQAASGARSQAEALCVRLSQSVSGAPILHAAGSRFKSSAVSAGDIAAAGRLCLCVSIAIDVLRRKGKQCVCCFRILLRPLELFECVLIG